MIRQIPFMVFTTGQFLVALTTIGLDSVLALYVLAVGLLKWSIPASTVVACGVSGLVPLAVP